MDNATSDHANIDQLADDIALCATRIDAATHQLLTHIRHFDEASGWARQGAKSCAAWLSWRIGLGAVAAREKVRVARALGELPLIDAALEKGELSYAKVRAITRVADADSEELLLHYARGATGAALEKICARFRGIDKHDAERRSVRRRRRPDGTVAITLTLEADEAESVWQALRDTKLALAAENVSAESAEAPPSMADAAVVMTERALASPPEAVRLAPERRQLLVHLREEHLDEAPATQTKPWVAELHDGTPLGGETLRRIGCDAGLVIAKLGERGNVLDVGRRRRTVTPAIWRALLTRQRHCCFPGCTHAVFVEAHHACPRESGGGALARRRWLARRRHLGRQPALALSRPPRRAARGRLCGRLRQPRRAGVSRAERSHHRAASGAAALVRKRHQRHRRPATTARHPHRRRYLFVELGRHARQHRRRGRGAGHAERGWQRPPPVNPTLC